MFSVFLYYYEIDYLGWAPWKFSAMMTMIYIDMIIAVVIYNIFLSKLSLRTLCFGSQLSESLNCIFLLLFTARVFFGMDPFVFVCVFGFPSNTIYYAFQELSMRAYFTKLVNPNIESTMMAFLTTVMYLGEETIARYLGILINRFVGVTSYNLNDLWKLYFAQTVCVLALTILVFILPSTEQIEKVQKQIAAELESATLNLKDSLIIRGEADGETKGSFSNKSAETAAESF